MASKINKYKLKGTETRADILDKIGGSGGAAKRAVKPRKKVISAVKELTANIKEIRGTVQKMRKTTQEGTRKKMRNERMTRKEGSQMVKQVRENVGITRTGPNKYPKMTKKQESNIGKQQLQIMKTREALTKNVRKAKRPAVKSKDPLVLVAAAAGAGGAYVAGRAVKKKEPAKLKKRSKNYMTRQFSDGTSEPYKVIKGSQFINQ